MLQCMCVVLAADGFKFVLQRLVNPKQCIIGESGTHNLVHLSYVDDEGKGGHCLLKSGGEQDNIGVDIPVLHHGEIESKAAILLSVAKHRLNVFQKDVSSRFITVRSYEKDSYSVKEDREIKVANLPIELLGEYPVVLKIEHGGKVTCKLAQAGIGKRSKSEPVLTSVQVVQVHTPPENHPSNHRIGCPCADCVRISCSSSYPPGLSPEYKK